MSAKIIPLPTAHRCDEHIVIKRGKSRYVCGRCRAPLKLKLKPTDVLMRVNWEGKGMTAAVAFGALPGFPRL